MIWAAFMVGLLGSLHCLGMCGPIALALPIGKGAGWSSLLSGRLAYNFGRIISYMILGVVLGSVGTMLSVAGMQQHLSIISGVVLLIIAIGGFLSWRKGSNLVNQFITRLFKGRFSSDRPASMLIIGILNGFLPCGMVYIAAGMALAEGTVMNAVWFMLFFGLGTIPLMLGVSLSPGFMSVKRRFKVKNMSPYIAAVMGVLFLLRGMNLDIPYLSPKVNTETEQMECCEEGH